MKKAFTLIEIMIVVGIIGLLAAVAIPNFVKSRNQANIQSCIVNLTQVDGAVQQWALDTKQADTAPVTPKDILPYLRNLPTCPSGGKTFVDSYLLTTVQVPPTCLKVPITHKLPDNITQ